MGGRLRRTDPAKERFWRRTVAEHRRSGLTIREFCARRSLSEPLFYAWRRELTRRELARRDRRTVHRASAGTGQTPAAAGQTSAAPRFISLKLADQPAATVMIEIVTRSGHTLRVPSGADRQTLAEVWALLEGQPC